MKLEFAEHITRHDRTPCQALNAQAASYLRPVREDTNFSPRILAGIGSGELPGLRDLATPEDVDDFAAMADDLGTELWKVILSSELLTTYQTPDSVLRRALEVSESIAPCLLQIAQAAVEAGQWPIARRRVLSVFEDATHRALTPVMLGFLRNFAQACAQSGLANEAADLLKEVGMEERLLPFYEALRAAAAGPGASLAHLAPEVRVPAEDLLKFLLEPPPPPESPAAKDKRGRPGRGERRNKRAGKES
jgi:hypothetical protein